MAQPSKYTPKLFAEICERLGGGEPLAVICRDEHMPHDTNVRRWCDADEQLALAIADARARGFDALAHECLEIAEDGSRDYIERENADGSKQEVFNSEHVQRSKLRIETRLKLLAKWDPKRYGDRQQVEHTVGAMPEDVLEWLNKRP